MQCPGCGSTRAFYQLLHLHPIAAFKLNPLMVLTLPFIVYGFLGFTRSALMGQPQRRVFIPPIYLWAWLVLLIFFWIFRNTPVVSVRFLNRVVFRGGLPPAILRS